MQKSQFFFFLLTHAEPLFFIYDSCGLIMVLFEQSKLAIFNEDCMIPVNRLTVGPTWSFSQFFERNINKSLGIDRMMLLPCEVIP